MKKTNLTRAERLQFSLPQNLQDILVGLILGDLCIRKSKTCVNVKLQQQLSLRSNKASALFGPQRAAAPAGPGRSIVRWSDLGRQVFCQGFLHKEYLMHLYDLFKIYCGTAPIVNNPAPDKRTGKIYQTLRFSTFSLPCFDNLSNLFYLEGKKVIPGNIGAPAGQDRSI